MKAQSRGGVILEDIKIGDIHYEYEHGHGIKVEVITTPERKNSDRVGYQWSWKAKVLEDSAKTMEIDEIIDYLITEGYEHYGPKLYDHEAYISYSKLMN